MRLFIALFAVTALLTSRANAHALLDHADPRVGNTVKPPVQDVRLWFTEKLEPALSKVQVFASDGTLVSRQVQSADPPDAAVLVVTFPALPAGKYKVVWRVVSVDTHLTKGDFSFTVSP